MQSICHTVYKQPMDSTYHKDSQRFPCKRQGLSVIRGQPVLVNFLANTNLKQKLYALLALVITGFLIVALTYF